MILLFLVVLIISICNASITTDHVARCEPGQRVKNECLQCFCTSASNYKCKSIENCVAKRPVKKLGFALMSAAEENCEPRMIYVHQNLTCMCSPESHWFNHKCQIFFGNLKPKNTKYKRQQTVKKAQRCEPGTYFIQDCNVCKCSPEGEIERSRCTRNNCSNKPSRRTIQKVPGSCITGNWYSLGPCQFCYCQRSNKLVCNIVDDKKVIELGQYKLNICGSDVLHEMVGLIPDVKILRNEEESNISPTSTTTNTTASPEFTILATEKTNLATDEYTSSSLPTFLPYEKDSNEDKKDYEIWTDLTNNTDPPNILRQHSDEEPNMSTAGPPPDDADNLDPKIETDELDSKYSDNQAEQVQQNEPSAHPLPLDPEQASPTVYKFNLPAVLDQIIHMALRKSMVRLNSESKCVPGSTKHVDCNFCYCLGNGKLLCTDRKCS